jgi:poly(3-hydroxyalkanoate) depolymerase
VQGFIKDSPKVLKATLQRLKRKSASDPASGSTGVFDIETVNVAGQNLRVGQRRGHQGKTPLLLFNGVGANLDLLEPFVARLDPAIPAVTFDVPGVGGSPMPRWPYRFSGVARLGDQLMDKLGYDHAIDVLGISWGGAVAQQFARDHPDRCRRLVLAATSPGAIMIPGKIAAIAKLVSPRRYSDPGHLRKVGGDLYGGVYRKDPELLHSHTKHIKPPRGLGYAFQLLAGTGWTSLPWLYRLRQPTLILHGTDDPIVPLTNAKILASLIPRSTLRVVDDGHLFLVGRAAEVAPIVSTFLSRAQA